MAEPLALNVTEVSESGINVFSQPYFVDYVKTLLQEEFSTDVLFKGGLTVKTTLDPAVQQAAETAAVENINKYPAAARDAKDLDIGMTVIDPKTGYIKAMVRRARLQPRRGRRQRPPHQPCDFAQPARLVLQDVHPCHRHRDGDEPQHHDQL